MCCDIITDLGLMHNKPQQSRLNLNEHNPSSLHIYSNPPAKRLTIICTAAVDLELVCRCVRIDSVASANLQSLSGTGLLVLLSLKNTLVLRICGDTSIHKSFLIHRSSRGTMIANHWT